MPVNDASANPEKAEQALQRVGSDDSASVLELA